MVTLFVYGTLRQGRSNHGLLERLEAKFLGTDSVTGKVLLILGGLPGLIKTSTGLVDGELYELPDESLDVLDRFEGVESGFYYRDRVTTTGAIRAWAYFACTGPEQTTALTATPPLWRNIA